MQRARTPKPPPANNLAILEPGPGFTTSVDMGGCHTYEHGYHEAGVGSVCTGTLRTIRHTGTDWKLTMAAAQNFLWAIVAHDDTRVLPDGSISDLRAGMKVRVSGSSSARDTAFHAVAIERE